MLLYGFAEGGITMRNPRRVVNIALIVIAILVVGAGVIAATSGGRSTQTGNAQACDAFWNWDDATSPTAALTTPVLSAYQKATTQPLTADLYNVSVGLKNQAKGLNGNKAANAAFAQQYATKVETDCTNANYPDPAT
jgi:hypothetical protein